MAINRVAGDEFAVLGAMANIANADWALGDLDAALASFRELTALARASPMSTRRLLGYALTKLGSVLTERGELTEALAVLREGLPLVREDGSAWVFLDDLALLVYFNWIHAAIAALVAVLAHGRIERLVHFFQAMADDIGKPDQNGKRNTAPLQRVDQLF